MELPGRIDNWIAGQERPASSGRTFRKVRPADGETLVEVARSDAPDVEEAVQAARSAQEAWADTPAVQRGLVLHRIVNALEDGRQAMAGVVAAETGKSPREAWGETGGAIQLGLFYASEGQRLYGRTTTSGVAQKMAMTVREPVGVAGLIIAANTPVANVAWKVFPALICGNGVVLKAAEDTPATAWLFARMAHEAGLPPGVLNVVQGYGEEAGVPLVAHPDVDVVSFTGSSEVGLEIAQVAARRLARVSLELGGKNPLVVCDDADLERAAHWVLLSAFSNAGQRCAAGSRILVFQAVYEAFRELLLERMAGLTVGPTDDDDLGPVINESQLEGMLAAVERAREAGATVLAGGHRLTGPEHRAGFYMAPTLVEGVGPDDELSTRELFGPIAGLYPVAGFQEAVALANRSPFGLTAAIHTRSVDRALLFTRKASSGVVVVNAGTYGSEPHMPFGGRRRSGNGTREPGTEALDVYSELKDVYLYLDPAAT